MKKVFCVILLIFIMCFCGCAQMETAVGPTLLAGTEAGVITAQFISCTTLQGAAVGAVVGYAGGTWITNNYDEDGNRIEKEE